MTDRLPRLPRLRPSEGDNARAVPIRGPCHAPSDIVPSYLVRTFPSSTADVTYSLYTAVANRRLCRPRATAESDHDYTL